MGVIQSFEQSGVPSRPGEFCDNNPSLEVGDFWIAAIGDHLIEEFRNGDPVVRAIPGYGTFCGLPVTRKVDLSLDGGG